MKLIAGTEEKPRILLNSDNQIIKFIHKRKYAARIKRNAVRLKSRNIATINIIGEYTDNGRHAVIYPKISANTVEELIMAPSSRGLTAGSRFPASAGNDDKGNILKKCAVFLAELHAKGIYWADPHFGNILLQDNGEFALIDLESIKILSRSLSINKRALNICRLIKKNLNIIKKSGLADFIKTYLATAGFPVTTHSPSSRGLTAGSRFPASAGNDGEQLRFTEKQKNKLCDLLIKKLNNEYINVMQKHAKKLAALDIASAVPVMHVSDEDKSNIDIELPKIPGTPVNELIQNNNSDMLLKIAKFAAHLHRHRIYNKDWSFSNIVLQNNGKLAFADNRRLNIYKHHLSARKRIKNFKQLLEDQHEAIKAFGVKRFVDLYSSFL